MRYAGPPLSTSCAIRMSAFRALRRSHPDDFDLQLELADLQELVIGRARALREGDEPPSPAPERRSSPLNEDAAEIAPEVERLDAKNWQRAIYIGLFFAVILFAAFFYLIQTARRLNMTPAEVAGQSSAAAPGALGTAKVTPQTGHPHHPFPPRPRCGFIPISCPVPFLSTTSRRKI